MKIDIIINLLKSNPGLDWDYDGIIQFMPCQAIMRFLNEFPYVDWDWDVNS